MGKKNLIRYSISRSAHQTRYKTQLNNITYQKVTNEKNYDIQKAEGTMARTKTAATFCKGNLTISIKNFNVLYFDPDMSPLLGIYLIDVCAEIHQHIYTFTWLIRQNNNVPHNRGLFNEHMYT